MRMTIRARVNGGVLEPLEQIDLPDGMEVTIMIRDVASTPDMDAFRRAAGSWKGTVDTEALIRNIYASRRIVSQRVPRLRNRSQRSSG